MSDTYDRMHKLYRMLRGIDLKDWEVSAERALGVFAREVGDLVPRKHFLRRWRHPAVLLGEANSFETFGIARVMRVNMRVPVHARDRADAREVHAALPA